MRNDEKRTPEAELEALKELVASEGWTILQEHVASAWGSEAFERTLEEELTKDRSMSDQLALTKRIQDTFKGVRAEARWVALRILQLEAVIAEAKKQHATPLDRYAEFRRVPR